MKLTIRRNINGTWTAIVTYRGRTTLAERLTRADAVRDGILDAYRAS